VAHSAGDKRYHDLDDTFGRVTENELVNAEAAHKYGAETRYKFLVRALLFPILNGAIGRWRLNWLITTNLRQRGPALRTILREVFVLRSTLSTKN
jgi:hypothetical protein